MMRRNSGFFCDNRVRTSIRLLVALLLSVAVCQVAWCQRAVGQGGALGNFGGDLKEPEPEPADENELPPAPTESYDEFSVDETLPKTIESKVGRIINEGKFANAQEEALVDQYFKEYFFARWSQYKNWKENWKTISDLPEAQKKLRVFFRRAKGGQVYDHLNELALDILGQIAAGNYHPTSRVNALLTIGELNVSESGGPLPEALKVLHSALNNPKLPDGIRAAALVGIQRHAAEGIKDEDERKLLVSSLLKLASAKVPTGRAASGREWMIAKSAEILGILGSPGENQADFKALVRIVSERDFSLSTRCIAAEAMGRLNFRSGDKANPADAAAALGQLAIDACAVETKVSANESKEEEDAIKNYRRLEQRLASVVAAVKGLEPLAQEPVQKTFLDSLKKNAEQLIKELDKTQNEGSDMTTTIDELRGKLEAWLKTKPA